jgi:hypothetical protein
MGKEKLVPVFAMILLLIGVFSTLYVHASQVDKDTIKISGREYTIDQIFSIASTKVIQTDEGEKTGADLEELIAKTGTDCSSCNQFTFKAKDGYQQTVTREIMKTGILTSSSIVYFPDTAHTFWVRDVIEIEVK